MLQSSGPCVTLVKPLLYDCGPRKRGLFFIYQGKALFFDFLLIFVRNKPLAYCYTVLIQDWETLCSVSEPENTPKSYSYSRIISCIRTKEALGIHLSLSKSLGQDRYLDDIIHTLAAYWGASRSQKERTLEGCKEKDKKKCIRPRAFPPLILFLLPWVSNLEEPHNKTDSWGAQKVPPTLSASYLLNYNYLQEKSII